jgi:hypothetical protein
MQMDCCSPEQTLQLDKQGKQEPVIESPYPVSQEEQAILLGLIPDNCVPRALKQVTQLAGQGVLHVDMPPPADASIYPKGQVVQEFNAV